MRHLSLASTALVCAWLLAAGCSGGPRPPLEALADAAKKVEKGGGTGRDLALAAWDAWLVGADASRMETLAGQAIERSPADPWAHLALAEAARRRLDSPAEAAALASLIERAPSHPLSIAAAGRLGELVRTSSTLDATIDARASALLGAGGLDPEAAARLRSAVRRTRDEQGLDVLREAVAAAGAMSAASVVGPFSPWSSLDLGTPFPPERAAPVAARFQGSSGDELAPRPFELPAGWLSLRPELRSGDVYYALAVATVPSQGRYVARLTTSPSTSVALFVDGLEISRRSAYDASAPTIAGAELDLPAGSHLVAIKVGRGSGPGSFSLSLAPATGAPSPIEWRAAKAGDGPGRIPRVIGALRTGARDLASRLEPEAGILGALVAARDARQVDPEGAKRVIASALELLPRSAPLLGLRADLSRFDETLPEKIGQARAAADLEAVLARDPSNPWALWSASSLLRGAGRHDDALEKLEAAGRVTPSSTLGIAKARIARTRGFDAQAIELAREVLDQDPGSCPAGDLVFELSRRFDAVADADAAATSFATCPGGRARLAGLLGDRGRDGEALRLARELAQEDPQDLASNLRLAERLLAFGEPARASEVVARLEAAWPRSSYLAGRSAELLERAGDAEGAQAARKRALALDGSDLALRRMAAFEAGADILAEYDRDGLEIIRQFEPRRRFDTPAVVLFDFGGAEVYADGSFVERIHTVAKILDKRGIDLLGEVNLPAGAEVIHLRTIKRDGRIVEPESIAGKDSISLPNLEVGDFVEIQYLSATASRGAALAGWSASPFYFRAEGTPLLESIYVVRAEKKAGLELDLHNGAQGAEVKDDGMHLLAIMRSHDGQVFLPEPTSVRRDEVLPWVQAGSGADEGRLASAFADNLAGSAKRSFEVAEWARAVKAGAPGQGRDRNALVRALYERVMEEIDGSDASFGHPASQVLAQKRGNRLLLLKAALDELGIENRYAAVRTFDQMPTDLRFPRPERWARLVLVVRPEPAGGLVWLDPAQRWAPFGQVEPLAQGAPAWLLPTAGEQAPTASSTPVSTGKPQGREVEMKLTLRDDGSLEGRGVERYLGFDAAWARTSLEKLDGDRRRQVVESALARGFRGLVLEELDVQTEGESGAPVSISYGFRVPDFAHDAGGGRVSVDLDFFAAQLGRRFLARGDRETPLLLRTPERVETRIDLELPQGLAPVISPEAARELGPHGSYKRVVAVVPGRLSLQEELEIYRGRVPPRDYAAFAGWVSAVDRAQAAELVLSRTGTRTVAPSESAKADPEPTVE
ncbi:hypothetical protein [Vulgatibacter incomptus]|uniref:Cell division protein FtsK n=1 Tax=Vulgatibacter incomptus TaxID=1391653 RepID=A0A0K1PGA3_9BACT|nr:hypothetical protein [Vulgatibacter incomptus]AKU92139.1 Cell division protein FtsK [Vulgatibacter incomptus]